MQKEEMCFSCLLIHGESVRLILKELPKDGREGSPSPSTKIMSQ